MVLLQLSEKMGCQVEDADYVGSMAVGTWNRLKGKALLENYLMHCLLFSQAMGEDLTVQFLSAQAYGAYCAASCPHRLMGA